MIHRIAQIFAFLVFKIFFGLRITGKENLPKKQGFIIASNHISYLDPVIIGCSVLPRKIAFMAKEALFKKRFFSFMLFSLRAFPVRRGSTDLSAIKTALGLLKKSIPLVMFPEGTRSQSGELKEAKGGLGFLALKAKVAVIPVFIKGSDRVLPRGARFVHFHKIRVTFGKAVSINSTIYQKGGRVAYKDISQEAMSCMRRLGGE